MSKEVKKQEVTCRGCGYTLFYDALLNTICCMGNRRGGNTCHNIITVRQPRFLNRLKSYFKKRKLKVN